MTRAAQLSPLTSWRHVPALWILLMIATVEVLSFTGHTIPLVNTISFWVILAATLGIGLYRLPWALALLLIELIISSKGYLFAVDLYGFSVSLRLGMFAVVFLAYVVWLLRDRAIHFFDYRYWPAYAACTLVVVYGAISGLLHGNAPSSVFFDANGYLYLGLVLPVTQALRNHQARTLLLGAISVAVAWIFFKTLAVLFLFAHSDFFLWETVASVYRWIRDTGVGEITRFPSGFSRVFFQSHIYFVLLFFLLLPYGVLHATSRRQQWGTWAAISGCLAGIFISYSRSFWVATTATLALAAVTLLTTRVLTARQLLLATAKLIFSSLAAFGLILLVINFPLPGHRAIDSADLLSERTTNQSGEAAVSSRKQLLSPLIDATKQHIILGSGLGASVTYISADPRVLETNPSGSYTTFAFEWGFLDLLYKFGLLGTAILAAAAVLICRPIWNQLRQPGPGQVLSIGLLTSLLGLAVVHFFTPYLNHPLGLGWIVVASVVLLSASHTRSVHTPS